MSFSYVGAKAGATAHQAIPGYASSRQSLWGNTESQVCDIKDDELRLQPDIAENRKAESRVRLETAVTGAAAVFDWCIAEISSRYNRLIILDTDDQVWQGVAAVKDNSAVSGAILSALDLTPVGVDDFLIEIHEGRAGIGNGFVGAGSEVTANSIATCLDGPVAWIIADWSVGELASVFTRESSD